MSNSQIYRQAREAVYSGEDRRKVFETYKDQIKKPIKLAMVIANIPNPELKARFRILNMILFILLVIASISKLFLVFHMFLSVGVMPAIGMALIGLIVPIACAVEVFRFSGQIYTLIPIFCALGVTQLVRRFDGDGLGLAIDLVFLLVIAGLSLFIKFKVFPNIGFGGVKKDPQGAYLF